MLRTAVRVVLHNLLCLHEIPELMWLYHAVSEFMSPHSRWSRIHVVLCKCYFGLTFISDVSELNKLGTRCFTVDVNMSTMFQD